MARITEKDLREYVKKYGDTEAGKAIASQLDPQEEEQSSPECVGTTEENYAEQPLSLGKLVAVLLITGITIVLSLCSLDMLIAWYFKF